MARLLRVRSDLPAACRAALAGWYADQGRRTPDRIDPDELPHLWRSWLEDDQPDDQLRLG